MQEQVQEIKPEVLIKLTSQLKTTEPGAADGEVG